MKDNPRIFRRVGAPPRKSPGGAEPNDSRSQSGNAWQNVLITALALLLTAGVNLGWHALLTSPMGLRMPVPLALLLDVAGPVGLFALLIPLSFVIWWVVVLLALQKLFPKTFG